MGWPEPPLLLWPCTTVTPTRAVLICDSYLSGGGGGGNLMPHLVYTTKLQYVHAMSTVQCQSNVLVDDWDTVLPLAVAPLPTY